MANSFLMGRYLPVDSYIHRLDAKVKIICAIIFLTALFINRSPILLINMLIFVIIISVIGKIGIKKLISSLKPLRFLLLFMIVFNVLFYKQGTILFEYGFIEIYSDALSSTFYFVTRLIVMISYTTVLTLTTAPLELASAIESLLKPLERVKFPAHEIGMMISIALRFIPTLFDETEKIMKAQSSRGIDFKNGKLKEKVRGIVALLIPLFINSLKRADDLANAMEVRGYTGGKNRTELVDRKFGKNEIICLLVNILILLLVIVIRFGGFYAI